MNRVKANFSSDSICFADLCMSNAKNFAGDKRKVGVEIRLYQGISLVAGEIFVSETQKKIIVPQSFSSDL